MSNDIRMFDDAKNFLAKVNDNHEKFVIASAVGAIAGVGLTAMSEKSNKTSLLVTAAAGAIMTMNIANSPELGLMKADLKTMAISGATIGGMTALVGAVSNALLGDKPSQDNNVYLDY